MNPPIKLALLLEDLEYGGTQRYAIHLLKRIDRELFSPILWVLRGGNDLLAMARESGIEVEYFSKSSWVGPESLARLAWRLLKTPPQILYTLTVVPNIWGRVFGRLARVPVLVSGYRSLVPKQHERWLWPLSDRIICNAHMLRDVMARSFSVPEGRIAVVPNGVDTDHFQPDPGPASMGPLVLSIGRLVEEKDPLNLLEGFRLVSERLPEVRFEIVGNGPLRPELEARIERYSLEARVSLLPGAADVRQYMKRASVFVLASVQEASPNVVIEAMAMGLPIVATRVGGIPELVEDSRTGILVEPRDPKALSDAVTTVITDETRGRCMGLHGRQRAESFHSMESMVRDTERVLLSAFEKKMGRNAHGG